MAARTLTPVGTLRLVVAATAALWTVGAWAQGKPGPVPRISFAACSQTLSAPADTPVSFAVGVTVNPDGTASNWRLGAGKGKNPGLEAEILQLLASCRFEAPQNWAQTVPIEKRLHVYFSPPKPLPPEAKATPSFRCTSFAEYPAAAVRNSEQGTAEVDVHVNAEGTLAVVDVVTSTGFRWLDLASLLELDACQFTPAADESGKAKAGTASFKKVWRLGR